LQPSITTIFLTGRLLAASMPVNSSALPAWLPHQSCRTRLMISRARGTLAVAVQIEPPAGRSVCRTGSNSSAADAL
jgi:hypothetical protein